jgi:hypothetical protein
LNQSHLNPPVNGVSVLILDKESYSLIVNNVSLLTKLYPVVKSFYPETMSLHLVSTSLSFFINNQTLELHNVEVVS